MPPLVNLVSCSIIVSCPPLIISGGQETLFTGAHFEFHTTLISIVEKDCNGDVLWTWSYPAVTESQKSFVTRKWNSHTKQNSAQSFIGAKQADVWIYIHSSEAFAANKLPRVKRCALVLCAKDFNPSDYQELCRIASNAYCESGDPVEVLRHYLFAFSEGVLRDTRGVAMQRFDGEWRMNNNHAKRLIKTFELETILIYTAILLKKRIFVYHHSLEELFGWIETFPTLMKHRNVTEYLFPWIDLVQDELSELKSYSYYIAGCRDSSISSKPDLFDLLVNIPAREITVASHAKESLTMTKAHKEIAMFMVQLCENDDESRGSIINEIAEKTLDLLNQLKTLAITETVQGKTILSAKSIRDRELPPAVENFLINLGTAENLFPLS